MLEQASSLYGDEAEVGDPDQKVLEEVEAIKVKHEQEIFDLKTEMKKKDELQSEVERTLNELKWDLNKEMKMKDELQKETEKTLNEVKKKMEEQIEESSKKTKEIIRLKTKFNKLDKLMNDHEKLKEEEITKMKEQCDLQMFQHELKFTFLQRKYDELNENHTKALASLDFVELRGNIYEINKDLLRKEVDDLAEFKKMSLNEGKPLKKKVDDLESENVRLKNESNNIKEKSTKEKVVLRKEVDNFKSEIFTLKGEKSFLKAENTSLKIEKETEYKKKKLEFLEKHSELENLKMENHGLKFDFELPSKGYTVFIWLKKGNNYIQHNKII